MRPLNRPMFKTGGPIKEGIMSGMKDNPQQLVLVIMLQDGSRPGYERRNDTTYSSLF